MAMVLTAVSRACASDCDPELNPPRPSRMDDFGLPIGQSRFSFSPEIKPIEDRQPCMIDENAVADSKSDNTKCEFIGPDGIRYTVVGSGVDKKELDVSTVSPNKVPFFLKPQASISDVVRNMQDWVDGPTLLQVDADKDRSYVTGSGCMINRLNIEFVIIFTFDDKERLSSISTTWVPKSPI